MLNTAINGQWSCLSSSGALVNSKAVWLVWKKQGRVCFMGSPQVMSGTRDLTSARSDSSPKQLILCSHKHNTKKLASTEGLSSHREVRRRHTERKRAQVRDSPNGILGNFSRNWLGEGCGNKEH